MRFGYSAKVNAFFLLDDEEAYRAGGTWQDDIIPVTEDLWRRFVSQPPEGKTRGAEKNGMPGWVDIPDREKREADRRFALKSDLLERAVDEIRMLTIVQDVYGLSDEEKGKLADWKKYLADVYRMEINSKDKVDWPRAPGKA